MAAAWPSAEQLKDFLEAAGYISDPLTPEQQHLDFASALTSAIADWEGRTGFQPFLAAGGATVKRFDPPDGTILWIPGASSVSSVKVGVWGAEPGTALTLDEGYFLCARRDGIVEAIEFACWQQGAKRSLAVEAVWGFVTMPETAYQAVLQEAARLIVADLKPTATGNLIEHEEGDVRKRYESTAQSGAKSKPDAWAEYFAKQAEFFRLRRMA